MSARAEAYARDTSKLPEIEARDLDTADVGLYRIIGKHQRADLYRPEIDGFDRDVEQIMLARIDDGPTELPIGCERAEIRADGKRLICAWVAA